MKHSNPSSPWRIRSHVCIALVLAMAGSMACRIMLEDQEYRRVHSAADSVMLTDGPWAPEFEAGHTLFERAGTGMAFRGARKSRFVGHGDGWDWEGYSLGKDANGVEIWFWSNTKFDGSLRGEAPVAADWGLSVVEHRDGADSISLERVMPNFEMESRAERDKSSDRAYVRVVCQSRAGEGYWDDAVIVWTRAEGAAATAEKPFRAARVRRDPESKAITVGRLELSLGEVVGNPAWETGRRIRF